MTTNTSMTTTTTTTTTTKALNSAVVAEAGSLGPVEVFRKDYQALSHIVSKVHMDFVIHDGKTTVTSDLFIEPNPMFTDDDNIGGDHNGKDSSTSSDSSDYLVLDGDESCVKLMSVSSNELGSGGELELGQDYTLSPGKLTLKIPKEDDNGASSSLVLRTIVEIIPEENTLLEGLYKADGMYCTQCEALGFRRITYFPDRPDNMSIFERVRIEADEGQYPVLLSNGNLIDSGRVDNSNSNNNNSLRHYAIWSDPFPKPSYLFAAVAGNLGCISSSYKTQSGRDVTLQIYSEPENVDKLDYAMESLKRAMKWDEDRFGLEYDLDLYNIVAVNSFNVGAMENKGLNVFNTQFVLADKDTATDDNFEKVENVIGHEYFHNWTGNRVTCRDWFQLTLKEGLTKFRDQEFSGDMNSKTVKRIETVNELRERQFKEDSGPMSHPIQPESYISMDNFYTATVYVKGAEVIRMYQTLVGKEGFRAGMDLYFERYDGSAVTCHEFRSAMEDANDIDLSQFALWYSTPGTPLVSYESSFDVSSGTFSLTLHQKSNSPQPLHIPVAVGLIDKETGKEVIPTTVLDLKEMTQTFEFHHLQGDVVPSILRDFSAPVKLSPAMTTTTTTDTTPSEDESQLAFLAARDTDLFNRWESGQKLYASLIFQTMDNNHPSEQTISYVYNVFERTLLDTEMTDFSIQAYALKLPSETALAGQRNVIHPVAIHKALSTVKKSIARKFHHQLLQRYNDLTTTMMIETEENHQEFKVDATSIGRRRLRNVLLDYLCSITDTQEEQTVASDLAMKHFQAANGITDKMAALSALASMETTLRDEALETFYQNDARGNALVMDKWFAVQAQANVPDVLDRVKKLMDHPEYTLTNPNRCRSLATVFTMNTPAFHNENGDGYRFIGELLAKIDQVNPQVASRLAAASLVHWPRYDATRSALMKTELEKLHSMKLSNDLFEIVNLALK